MAVTAFPIEGSPDLALLNVARLFTRLEHNLLSPGTDRRSFQQSEYQRMRVNKVSIYSTLPMFYFQRTYFQGDKMYQNLKSNQRHRTLNTPAHFSPNSSAPSHK